MEQLLIMKMEQLLGLSKLELQGSPNLYQEEQLVLQVELELQRKLKLYGQLQLQLLCCG